METIEGDPRNKVYDSYQLQKSIDIKKCTLVHILDMPRSVKFHVPHNLPVSVTVT